MFAPVPSRRNDKGAGFEVHCCVEMKTALMVSVERLRPMTALRRPCVR